MENQINDGGAAFPCEGGDNSGLYPERGMSLRDYFAARALQGLMVSEPFEAFRRNDYDGRQQHNTYLPAGTFREFAEAAYRFADAMLAARDAAPADPLRDVTARLHKLSGRYCHVRREWNYHTVSSAPECTFGIYIGSPGGGFAESGPDLPALVARAEAWIAQQNSGTTEPDPDAHAAQQELDIAAQLDGEQEDRERRDALKARTDGLPGCCLHCGTVVNAMGRAADGRPHPGPACLENKGGAPC